MAGKIQSSVNQLIGTASVSTSIMKGISNTAPKQPSAEDLSKAEANRKIQLGKETESSLRLKQKISGEVEKLKEGKKSLSLAKEGYEMIEGNKIKISGVEEGTYQNELIKKYRLANREQKKIIDAMKLQQAGKIERIKMLGGK